MGRTCEAYDTRNACKNLLGDNDGMRKLE